MKKYLAHGLALMAGAVSVPAALAPPRSGAPSAEHRRDPRLSALRSFFSRLGCPAQNYAHAFVEAADANALDWRLLPSISFIESTGGKMARDNNLFGWDSGRAKFSSPTAAIHSIAWRLSRSRRYRNKSVDEKLAIYNSGVDYPTRVKSVMRQIASSE